MNNPTNCFEFDKAFDAAFLNELYEGDLSYVIVVFKGFLEETPLCYRDMDLAFHNNNISGLKSAAHKCKTLFAYVGLNEISNQLRELEIACGTIENTAAVDSLFHDLFRQKNIVEKLVSEEIKRIEAFL